MPRMGRVVQPNYPHHVVQRGHNRQVVFSGESYFRIEPNSARAAMVSEPGGYGWSSYRQHADVDAEVWIDYDPCYLGLGDTDPERAERYRQLGSDGVSKQEKSLIRQALQRGQLAGNNRFVDHVERILGRRVEFRAQGRPGKADD